MTLLKEWWRWFWRQSRLNKVVIVGLSSSLVLFLIPSMMSWFKPTPVRVGVAFYTYERAFLLEGDRKTYFYEKRNLVSDCSLRRIEHMLPRGRTKTPDPQSWILSKFLLENVSDQSITNFRMSIKSPLLRSTTTLQTTPDMDATGKLETTPGESLHTYIIAIPAIAPTASTVLILMTPIDETIRQFVYVDHGRVTIQVPFLSADQFGTFPLKVSRLNAMKILNRESVLRRGDETFAGEKIEFAMLGSEESNLKEPALPYRLLPKARLCPGGTAGEW
jgi:hypothetical protein